MRRSSARVVTRLDDADSEGSSPLWALAGFALGATAGWLIGELTGMVSRDRVARYLDRKPARRPDRDAPLSAKDRIRAVLEADPDLRDLGLVLIPAGRTAVELHGWVPTRMLRARATRLAATAAGATRLVDCLLVRGEDDRPTDLHATETPRSA